MPRLHVTVVSPGSVDTPIYRQAANFSKHAGRPPAPADSAARIARAIVKALDEPRDRISVGRANLPVRAGFSLLPKLFDVMVGPLFSLAAAKPGAHPPQLATCSRRGSTARP